MLFLLGLVVGWFLADRSASAVGKSESVGIRNPHPIPTTRPMPTVIRGGCIFPNGEELPPLSPDQVLGLVGRRAGTGGGWPT